MKNDSVTPEDWGWKAAQYKPENMDIIPTNGKKKRNERVQKWKEISSYSEPQGVVHEAPGSPETVVESVLVPVREKTALTTCTFIK